MGGILSDFLPQQFSSLPSLPPITVDKIIICCRIFYEQESSHDFTEYGRKPALRSEMDKRMLEMADSGRCKVKRTILRKKR